MTNQTQRPDLLQLTTQIVTSQKFMGPSSQFHKVLREVYEELKAIHKEETETPKSTLLSLKSPENRNIVGEDYIICLEDNTSHKSLKRYLKARFHITWYEYLEKHGLPLDSPSVCYSLSKSRSKTAKSSKMWEMK